MRFNPYDDVFHANQTTSSVAIASLTGASAVKGAGIDTLVANPLESLMVHIRTEIATGTPDAASLAWALQESDDDVDGNYAAAKDNTGAAIGGTLDCKTVANDAYARIEGIGLQPTGTAPTVPGGRKRWLRIVCTPSFTNGTSPGILRYVEFIGSPASGMQLPVRTTVSNT